VSVTLVSPAEIIEPIDMSFGVWTRVGPRNFEWRRGRPIVKYREGLSDVNCAKTAEPIDMLFGMWTRVGPRKHALDKDARWRNRANTIEPSMCFSDAAFLSNFFDYLLRIRILIFVVSCVRELTT